MEDHGFTIDSTDPMEIILSFVSDGSYAKSFLARPELASRAAIGFSRFGHSHSHDKDGFVVVVSWKSGLGAAILELDAGKLHSAKLPESLFVDLTSITLSTGVAVSLSMTPGLHNDEAVVVIEICVNSNGTRRWPGPDKLTRMFDNSYTI
jgi:hypothetical protein